MGTHPIFESDFDCLTEMAALPRRILKETQKLTQDPVPGIEAIPDEKNARYFHIKVFGPADSPYENGKFDLELFLPEEYPMAPPKVNSDLIPRQDVLKDKWSPALQIR